MIDVDGWRVRESNRISPKLSARPDSSSKHCRQSSTASRRQTLASILQHDNRLLSCRYTELESAHVHTDGSDIPIKIAQLNPRGAFPRRPRNFVVASEIYSQRVTRVHNEICIHVSRICTLRIN